jgi:hypothetical protein
VGKRNVIRKLAGLSAIEVAKEEALRLHLQAALDNRPAPQVRDSSTVTSDTLDAKADSVQSIGPKPAKKKRKSRQNRDLERALLTGEPLTDRPLALPHVRGFDLYALGYSLAHISRTLAVHYDTVREWRAAHDWEARRDAIQVEADHQRAVQIGTIRDLGHHTSVRILEHVADSLGDLDDPRGLRPDAEDLRDLATAAEKAVKTVVPQEGSRVGVQVNIVDALAESRKYEIVEAVVTNP